MNLFAKDKLSETQLRLLSRAKEFNLDTKHLKDSKFKIKQLRCLILAEKDGVDIKKFANPNIDYYTMLLIVQCAKQNLNYEPLLSTPLDQTRATAIYYNLTSGIAISSDDSTDELFNKFEVSTGLSRQECQIPVYIEWSQRLSEILL